MLDGPDSVLALATAVTALLWLAAASFVYVTRPPPDARVGQRTLDLGPEPPAVANLLVHRWQVTDDAVPATLLDLAARNVIDVEERSPGVFYVRLRQGASEALTAYEHRVLDHLRGLARDGVVPAEALTTGPHEQSKRWFRAFACDVVADAKVRGLSRDAVGDAAFTALTVAAAVPAALAWALWEFEAGVATVVGPLALVAWIRSQHPPA